MTICFGAYPSEAPYGTSIIGLAAGIASISLGWLWRLLTNALAYCDKELITTVKYFIEQATWAFAF